MPLPLPQWAKTEWLFKNRVTAVSRNGTVSVLFVLDNKFLGQLASLLLHVDAKDRPLLRYVPETDIWLMAMKHRDTRADQLEMSHLVDVDIVKPRERWSWTLRRHTQVVDSDAGMQIGHTEHRLAGVQGLRTQHWDSVVGSFPVAVNLKCVDVNCHYITLRHTYMPQPKNYPANLLYNCRQLLPK